jgi:hypothetical protein
MRITEEEKTSFSKFRDVSDLRTQFQCEYRLHLIQQRGRHIGKAAIDGSMLHSRFSMIDEMKSSGYRWLRVLALIIIIIVGILWVVW